MRVVLLAAGTLRGFTVTVPAWSGGQPTVTGGAVAWRVTGGLLRNCSVAVKLAGPADPGAVAGTSSVNVVVSYRRITTTIWVLAANLTGAFLASQQVLLTMMRERWGRIINISSVVAEAGNPGQANYVASKAGLIGLTKSLAQEMASRNITVNAITPGFIETDMTAALSPEQKDNLLAHIPLKRFGKPEDVAAAVCFLASDEAAYITGHVLAVNGGMYM